MSKNFLASKTVLGVLIALLGHLWSRFGWTISDVETTQIATWAVSSVGYALALYGRCKTKGELLTLGRAKTGLLSVMLLIFVSVGPIGCAISTMTAVEQGRTYTDVLMTACDDIQDAYETKWASATTDEKTELADVGKKINAARAAIILATDAVVTWSEADEGDTEAAQEAYETLYTDAKAALAKATTAWNASESSEDTTTRDTTTTEEE